MYCSQTKCIQVSALPRNRQQPMTRQASDVVLAASTVQIHTWLLQRYSDLFHPSQIDSTRVIDTFDYALSEANDSFCSRRLPTEVHPSSGNRERTRTTEQCLHLRNRPRKEPPVFVANVERPRSEMEVLRGWTRSPV